MFLEIIMIRSKILSGNEAGATQLSLALFQYRFGYFRDIRFFFDPSFEKQCSAHAEPTAHESPGGMATF